MARITWKLLVLALVVLGAGIAAAQSSLIAGPPPGIASPLSPLTQVAPSVTAATPTSGGVTSTTVGDTTTVTGATNPVTTTPTTTTPATVPGTTPTIQEIVSLTRTVAVGTSVSAFAVPAGTRLIVTDVIVTNPGTSPACGAGVAATGGTTTASTATTMAAATTASGTTTSVVTTSAATDLASTGVLCVPAQTSLTLALSTGLEFVAGQNVVLANGAPTSGGTTSGGGPLSYHLRGFLISGAV